MTLQELKKYKKVLIIGYGLEGKSVESFLRNQVPDIEIGIADKKDGENYLEKQKDYELAIRSPGVNKKFITIPHTTPTNIFFANAKAPIIGVTGTKGKSTTTSLIYAMFIEGGYDARLCGNIGKPMLDELLKPTGSNTVYVCELSSYQLDDIKYSPHIGLIINLFPEHLDYHGGFEEYKKAKTNITKFMREQDVFVYNREFRELAEIAKSTRAKVTPVLKELPFKPETKLLGAHNIENIKAAYTVAKLMNIDNGAIEKSIREFTPLSHRLEFVGNFNSIDFYDDAISTTPESTIQALETIPNIDTVFLGGTDRGYNFSSLAQKLVASKARNIVLFPDSGEKIKNEILKIKNNINFFETRNMKEAVEWAYDVTEKGGVVILSCASPSYSLWKNFEEKGDLFKRFVRELAH